jgi:hypothetical protein
MGKDRTEEDIPAHEEQSRKEGEKHRRELDEVPAPGTDPLHEGP